MSVVAALCATIIVIAIFAMRELAAPAAPAADEFKGGGGLNALFHYLEAKGMPAGLPRQMWYSNRNNRTELIAWSEDPNWRWPPSVEAANAPLSYTAPVPSMPQIPQLPKITKVLREHQLC